MALETQVETAPVPSRGGALRGGLLGLLVLLLAAGLVAAAVLTGYFADERSNDAAVTSSSQQALAAATTEIVTATSYRYTTFAANEKAALADLTPAFATSYRKVLNEAEGLASTYRAVVQSAVEKSAVERYGASSVVVMIFLDQTSTETVRNGAQTSGYRLLVTMQRLRGRWLIAGISAV
jgi:Mce-associated membrane protein